MNTDVPWESGKWTTRPTATVAEHDGRLLVTAVEGSDAWLKTGYGFVHDDAHALLADWDRTRAVEVAFTADFDQQFDQAGIMIRIDDERWIKTGAEYADGALQIGAVVTDGKSDWSTAPVPEWAGREITVRISQLNDAVIVRARCGDEPWRLVRLAPLDPDDEAQAGPFCCAPSRPDLTVAFGSWRLTDPDQDVH